MYTKVMKGFDMKDNYSPYPGDNPYRFGTLEHDDYEDWRNTFYNDKHYHVKRIEKGKKIKDLETLKTIISGVISAVFAAGVVVHGIKLIEFMDYGKIFKNIVAIILNMSGLNLSIEEGVIDHLRRLKHINQDLNASRQMVHELSDKEGTKHGLWDIRYFNVG